MHDFLVNLLVGIIGGIYSSAIVSRVFLIREELEEQLSVLRKKTYYFGFLMGFFEGIETIKKCQSDTLDEMDIGIIQDPDYMKTHDIIHVSDKLIKALKEEMLDKTIEKICHEEDPLALKHKHFVGLKKETEKIVSKYKEYKEFKFETIDDSKKELQELERKYEKCLSRRNRYLFEEIIKDKIIIVLFVVLIVVCVLTFVTR